MKAKTQIFKWHCWFNTFHSIILFLIDTKWQKNWRLNESYYMGQNLAVSGNPLIKTFAGKRTQCLVHAMHIIFREAQIPKTEILGFSTAQAYFIFLPRATLPLWATSVSWRFSYCFLMQKNKCFIQNSKQLIYFWRCNKRVGAEIDHFHIKKCECV